MSPKLKKWLLIGGGTVVGLILICLITFLVLGPGALRGGASSTEMPALYALDSEGLARQGAKEWGPGGIDQRFGAAWTELVPHLPNWLDVVERRGPAAVREAYFDTLQGRVPPYQGLILSLAE